MKEKTFIELIKQIKFEKDRQDLLNRKLQIILPESRFHFFDRFEVKLFDILKEEFSDKDDWIGWWVYEKDFGSRKDLTAKHQNGKKIKLDTPQQLYKFLIKNHH